MLLAVAADLWALLPEGLGDAPFTTRELAARLDRPDPFAQRVTYCLRLSGAAETVGTLRRRRVYVRAASARRSGSGIQ